MLPSVAPTVALYARMTREVSSSQPWLFGTGYLLTWAVGGVVAYVVGVVVTTAAPDDALAWDQAGRALAGAQGNAEARIFCREFHAELVAIAGHYKVLDDIPEKLRGKPVQVWLENDQLKLAALE